ncbi:hypothetical protein [Lentzea californiensis]|uniref:hypothetical protein n=1 Tax=Lentzea californiensis TaxID=438851 RepID=UPI002165265B|nr:hypothetical protein [Lentzea californiensis]
MRGLQEATHRLPRFVFDEICDGTVSRGQCSIRKLRLRTFAEALVHEIQHFKVNALLDLVARARTSACSTRRGWTTRGR